MTEILHVFAQFWTWPGPLFLLIGTLLGFLFGMLPGLGGTQVMALLIPLSYTLSPENAIVLLIAAMGAVPLGGSIPSILLNTPGTGSSAATMLDGYPMTKQGKGGIALGVSITSNGVGAMFGAVSLLLILPIGKYVVLSFSYPEFFMMAMLGICIIGIVSEGSMWKGLVAGGLGLVLSTVGMNAMATTPRFTFGSSYLWDGIQIIPVVIGMFAIPELTELFLTRKKIASTNTVAKGKDVWTGMKAVFKHPGTLIRGSLIGTFIGIVPGVGSGVATWTSYAIAKKAAKDSSQFGKGDVRGIIAPESANNANDGGALVPTVIFGIPGGAEMAVFLGALVLHGLTPGPSLLNENIDVMYMIVIALVSANVLVSIIALLLTKYLVKVTLVPTWVVAPIGFALVLIGAYATNGRLGDVIVTLIFGALGLIMKNYGFSRIALLIALVLGGIAEESFHQTLLSMGPSGFFTRPISLLLFLLTASVVLWPVWKLLIKRVKGAKVV